MRISEYYFEPTVMALLGIKKRARMYEFARKYNLTKRRIGVRAVYLRSEVDKEVEQMIALMPEHQQFAESIKKARIKLQIAHNCDFDLDEWLPAGDAVKAFKYSRRALNYLATFRYGKQIRTTTCGDITFYYKPDIERYNDVDTSVHPLKRNQVVERKPQET